MKHVWSIDRTQWTSYGVRATGHKRVCFDKSRKQLLMPLTGYSRERCSILRQGLTTWFKLHGARILLLCVLGDKRLGLYHEGPATHHEFYKPLSTLGKKWNKQRGFQQRPEAVFFLTSRFDRPKITLSLFSPSLSCLSLTSDRWRAVSDAWSHSPTSGVFRFHPQHRETLNHWALCGLHLPTNYIIFLLLLSFLVFTSFF